MAMARPRLSITVQRRSCSGLSPKVSTTCPSVGARAWMAVICSSAASRSTLVTIRSPDRLMRGETRNFATVRPVGSWLIWSVSAS
jgi:hypothetical protein